MKKWIVLLLAAFLALAAPALAAEEDFVLSGTTLTGYTGSGGDVVIPEELGITAIGYRAFMGNAELTSMVIPDSVTTIGEEAFAYCSALSSVSLPSGLRHLPDSVFERCESLVSVSLPDGLRSIGASAFFCCSSLGSVSIPDSVASIGTMAFAGCSAMTSIKLPASLAQLDDLTFSNCTSLRAVYVPSGVSRIGSYALNASALRKLVIPETVKVISDIAIDDAGGTPKVYCFAYSPAHTWAKEKGFEIVLMDESSFSELNGKTALADMTMEAGSSEQLVSYAAPDSLRWARSYESSDPQIVSIDSDGMLTAHAPGSARISVTIDGVSASCTVTAVSAPAAGEFVVSGTTLTGYTGDAAHVVIHEDLGITHISAGAFGGSTTLRSIVIPEGVTDIAADAFAGCHALERVTLPSSLREIGDCAFKRCGALREIDIPESVTSIGREAFYECGGLTRVSLPEGLLSLGRYAFYECGALRAANLPSSLTSLGECAFSYCGALSGEFVIPAGITRIPTALFDDCCGITRITLHDGVTAIGESAFRNCESLVEVNIPEGIEEIPYMAFYGCRSLRSLYVPDSVTVIGSEAFGSCYGLVDLRLPEQYELVGSGQFAGCGFESITLPAGVTSLPYNIFSGNRNLKYMDLPEGLTELSDWSITLQYGLESFAVPEGVTRIGEAVFMNCPKLTELYIPDSVTSFGERIAWMGIEPYDKKPTIYCSAGSAAEAWAEGEGFPVVHTGGKTFKELGGRIELPAEIALAPGASAACGAQFFPVMDGMTPKYTSGDATIFTVDADGCITAKACGSALLTVSLGGVKATAEVFVYTPVEDFSLTDSVFHMTMGETAKLRVTEITPSGADEPLQFFSDDDTVLTIDEDGVITAGGEGCARVTVSASCGAQKSCLVYVHPPKALAQQGALCLNSTRWAIALSGLESGFRLRASLSGGGSVADAAYESSDPAVASVNAYGYVRAVGAGEATITVTSGLGLSASCRVTVEGKLRTAVLPAAMACVEASLFAGDTALRAVVIPEGVTSIGGQAFADCAALDYAVIPDSVAQIAEDAFAGCEGVTILCGADSCAARFAAEQGIDVMTME